MLKASNFIQQSLFKGPNYLLFKVIRHSCKRKTALKGSVILPGVSAQWLKRGDKDRFSVSESA
jgi:hypothetical protein